MTRPTQEIRGTMRLSLIAGADGTRVASLYQRDPLRLLRPNSAPGDPLTGVLVTTSGGLVAGDQLDVQVHAGANSRALLVGQSADKVYRSEGARVVMGVNLSVDRGACLEWLPQETILFDGARLCRTTNLHLTTQSQVLAGEILVLGRLSSGERFTRGSLRDAWQVRLDGRLVWLDALELKGNPGEQIAAAAAFAGAHATATLVHWGPELAARIETVRGLLPTESTLRAGASLIHGLLVVRWLAHDPLRLRKSYAEVWSALRAAAGYPPRLPRLWYA